MSSTRLVAFVVTGALAAALTAPGAASGASLACGTRITTNTTLHADLVDCPKNGIVIGADNITLNLNGHTIEGGGRLSHCSGPASCDIGVDNSAGHHGVAIVRGTIRDFNIGIHAQKTAHDRLRRLSVSHNTDFGIFIGNSTDSRIVKTLMTNNGTNGLVLFRSRHSVIARDTVKGSRGYGINLVNVDDSVIQHNVLSGNDHGLLAARSSRNLIQRNFVSHSGGSSIDFGDGAANNRIRYNRLSDNGDGIIATKAHGNLISHNSVTGTGFFGFPDAGGFGLILDGSANNTVDSNTITGGRGPAIFVTKLDAPSASADNVISRNVANSKLSDGILVNNGAARTLVKRNTATGSGHDGIHVDAPATILTQNSANQNHNLGIEAIPGVTDGGGNHAAANGNPLQCTNVAC